MIKQTSSSQDPGDRGRRLPGILRRPLALALLLVLSVQGLSLVPLLSHWACADHCEAAADCHPSGEADDQDGCDPGCACLGCPAHTVGLALLNDLIDLGRPFGTRAQHAPVEAPSDRQLVRSVFRPPCS